jgi:CubicO group peptidase (beta-lactamase class C family)
MKIFFIGLLHILSIDMCNAQVDSFDNKKQIEELLHTFMKCIATKDSNTLYGLFADAPVTWVGVWKPTSQSARRAINTAAPAYKVADYKTWFRNVIKNGSKAELFSNPVIAEDGTVGSVTFDYSFWVNNIKGNWGKESWGLIKLDGKWKIASVLFSMDLEKNNKQPEAIHGGIEIKHEGIEKFIQSFVDTAHFQGTVLIAQGDSIIHQAAYGMFDVENMIPNTINTQFLIGSLTKSFVGVSIMQLVEQGLVDLHAQLQTYLPNLKHELAEGLTVHHLLKQQSGLASSFDDLTDFDIMDITPDELLVIINKSKRSFKAGERHEYSNINYTLLALVIESVTGKKYQGYLQEKTFSHAGMGNTGMERLTNMPLNRAIGYRNVNGIFRRVQNVVSYALGAGDMYSTISDLFKWSKALHGNKLVSAKSKSMLFDGGNKEWGYYGYGFRIQPYQRGFGNAKAGKLIRHGGTMNGFISNYHYYEEDNLTIIILSNYRNTPIRKMSYGIKEIVLKTHLRNRRNTFEE